MHRGMNSAKPAGANLSKNSLEMYSVNSLNLTSALRGRASAKSFAGSEIRAAGDSTEE